MAKLVEVYACTPGTERGRGILVDADAQSSTLAYCNGRSVVLRRIDLEREELLLLVVYSQHSYPVSVARFSPNGQWVASADVSGRLRIWARGGEHTLKCEYHVLSGCIDDLQWSSDGARIVVCGDGKGKSFVRAIMWDTGTSIGDFDGSSRRVLSCDFRPIRPFRIATGGEDFIVNLYEGPPFKFKASHRDHTNYVNCVRFSPDGTKLVTVSSDKKVLVYDGKSGDRIGACSTHDGHTGSVYAVSWNRQSNQLLTVSADKTAKVWSLDTDGSGISQATYTVAGNGAEDMQVGCIWLTDLLVTISLGGNINLLSLDDTSGPKKVLGGHTKSITAVALSGSDVYSSSYDGVVIQWKLGLGFVRRLQRTGAPAGVDGLTAFGDMVAGWGQEQAFFTSGGPSTVVDLGATCYCLSLGNNRTALACTDKALVMMRQGLVVSKLAVSYPVTAVALSRDASMAIAGSKTGSIYVYSIGRDDHLSQEAVLERHRGGITVLEFCPDGSMFASGDENREAVVWDAATRQVKLKNMLYHTARLKCIAWSGDGTKVATGSVDGCVYVYTIGEPASSRLSLKGAHAGAVSGLAFEEKPGGRLVTGGDDACVKVWSID